MIRVGGEDAKTAAGGSCGAVLAFQSARRCAVSQTSAAVSPVRTPLAHLCRTHCCDELRCHWPDGSKGSPFVYGLAVIVAE